MTDIAFKTFETEALAQGFDEVAHGAPHAERYGPAGATYRAARRGTRTAA